METNLNRFDRKEDRDLEANENAVFQNPLIVHRICSFTNSSADLRNFRLLSHVFHNEATKRFQRLQKYIFLSKDSEVNDFLSCFIKSKMFNLTLFPLSAASVEVDLNINHETLNAFGATVGQYVRRYSIQAPKTYSRNGYGYKLVNLLSHSRLLTELRLKIVNELCICEADLTRLPLSFPRLKLIRFSSLSSCGWTIGTPVLLIDHLIRRAPNLERFVFPPIDLPRFIVRIIRCFIENHPHNLPLFSFEDSKIDSNWLTVTSFITPFIQQLIDHNVKFSSICVFIRDKSGNDDEVRIFLRTITAWLEAQINCLTSLSIAAQLHGTACFTLPSLQALKKMTINFRLANHRLLKCGLQFEKLEGNQFPNLETICLEQYRDDYQIFGSTSCMPSVKKLHVRQFHSLDRSRLNNLQWHVCLPNLTSLHLEFNQEMDNLFRQVLVYILTTLTRLVHLDLDWIHDDSTGGTNFAPNKNKRSSLDYWSILTGGIPRPVQSMALSHMNLTPKPEDVEKTVNGIFRVPWLRNMKVLKTLRFFPRLRTNLDAILNLSRTGLLVRLQELTLSTHENEVCYKSNLKDCDSAAYKEELSKFHQKVVCVVKVKARAAEDE